MTSGYAGDSIVWYEAAHTWTADESIANLGTLQTTTIDTYWGAGPNAPPAGGTVSGPLIRPFGHILIAVRVAGGAVAHDVQIMGSITGAPVVVETLTATLQFRAIARNLYWPRSAVKIVNNGALSTFRICVTWLPGPIVERGT